MSTLSERIRQAQDYEPPLFASEVLLRDTCGQWADEVEALEDEIRTWEGNFRTLSRLLDERKALAE